MKRKGFSILRRHHGLQELRVMGFFFVATWWCYIAGQSPSKQAQPLSSHLVSDIFCVTEPSSRFLFRILCVVCQASCPGLLIAVKVSLMTRFIFVSFIFSTTLSAINLPVDNPLTLESSVAAKPLASTFPVSRRPWRSLGFVYFFSRETHVQQLGWLQLHHQLGLQLVTVVLLLCRAVVSWRIILTRACRMWRTGSCVHRHRGAEWGLQLPAELECIHRMRASLERQLITLVNNISAEE